MFYFSYDYADDDIEIRRYYASFIAAFAMILRLPSSLFTSRQLYIAIRLSSSRLPYLVFFFLRFFLYFAFRYFYFGLFHFIIFADAFAAPLYHARDAAALLRHFAELRHAYDTPPAAYLTLADIADYA